MKSNSCSLLVTALLGALLVLDARAGQSDPSLHLRIDVDRPVLPCGATEKLIVKVALDCPRPPLTLARPPINLAVALDRSGSMSGEKIRHAKAAVLEAPHRLGPDDWFSLVVFDDEIETVVPACRLGTRNDLEARIASIEARGSTAIYAGVTTAVAELRKHAEDREYSSRLVLLSDGLANRGPGQPADFARLGAALVREGISVSTVGVGLDYNEDLMTQLARKSDGNTYFVSNSSDLPRIFNAELGDALEIVARRAVVTIEFAAGVRPIAFIGREGAIHGQSAEFSLNQLCGGQEKLALVEVEVSAEHEGTLREIASARVAFEDASNRRAASVQARSSVRFTAVEREVIDAADRKVQADSAENVTALAKDAAIGFIDANRPDDAARTLRQRNAELVIMGQRYANAEVQSLAAFNSLEADRLAREGLDNAGRKKYRAENAQKQSQQSSSFDLFSRSTAP